MKKRTPQSAAAPSVLEGEQRINKILAAAGLGSRRQVDELIEQGRVEVDGKAIQQVGVKINPATANITVDGEPLRKHRPVYFALHKPEGVLCTNRDPQGRMRVVDMVPNQFRLFPVGRLDASSTGLILLTNDGELAQRLTHPRHGVPKRYAVTVAGQVETDSLRRLQRGIHLAEGRAKVDNAKLKRIRKGCTELEITLSEGKNREIRRVLARLGHKVVSLRRIGIGPLKLGDLPEGAYRPLGMPEVEALYNAVETIKRARKQERKDRKKSPEEPSQRPFKTKSRPIVEKALGEDTWDEEEILAEPEEGILVRDSDGDAVLDDDWSPPASQRVGAVIGDDDYAPTATAPGDARSKRNRAPQKHARTPNPRPAQPGIGRPGKTARKGKPFAERGPGRGGTAESIERVDRPVRSRKGGRKPPSVGKRKPRDSSTKNPKRRGK